MSYTTRCPACGTTFKVVSDQLKISDGWVRCGHCSDVFDATLYLEEWTDGPAEPPAPQPSPPVTAVEARTGPVPSESTSEDDRDTEPMPLPDRISDALARALAASTRMPTTSEPAAAAAQATPPATNERGAAASAPTGAPAVREARVSEDFHAELLEFATLNGGVGNAPVSTQGAAAQPAAKAQRPRPDKTASKREVTSPAPAPAAAIAPTGEDDGPEAGIAEDTVPEFVQKARRQAFWRRPLVRAGLSLCGLLLSVVLLAQVAYHERQRLVAWEPGLEPVIHWLCAPGVCPMDPLRRIDDIVIESTALVRGRGDVYAFNIVLKNRANLDLAVPALELTLTDFRDQTLARRVFLPEDWPGQPKRMPARGELPVSLSLSIQSVDGVSMAGYRAFVFYP
jgi:predicted Zn finger-like uncharacterized protein